MSPLVLSFIGASIVATSFMSGIFGMAGGLVLLGVLLVFMDVAPAMVLFAIIQTAANGWRSVLWWRHVQWGIVWRHIVGAAITFAIMRSVAFIPDKALVYLALGTIVFAADLMPRQLTPDISRPGAPYVCGMIIMFLQLIAGAAGHVLDLFFQKSQLDRKTIVGTKAVTQVAGHLFRLAYFGSFAQALTVALPPWQYGAAIILAICGTTLAARVLERMTDASFRIWSRRIIVAISIVYLLRGVWLILNP
jgi:uncharacterized membrane protein YfcA